MERVLSNIGMMPYRSLAKQYDNAGTAAGTTKAIGISAPTTRAQTMGLTNKCGVNTVLPLDGGTQILNFFLWSQRLAEVNSGNGWAFAGANTAEYQKSTEAKGLSSFTAPEGVPFFIQAATTPITNAFVSMIEDPVNPNTIKGATA